MKFLKLKTLAAGAILTLAFHPHPLLACAACYGASDSPMAKGMNWGIFSLLGVVAVVLGCIASFFVFIGKKSAEVSSAAQTESAQKPDSTQSK